MINTRMNATDNIATDLFYKIRSRFRGLKLGADNGTITIKPNEARFFDFDYMEGETPIGHISISLAEPNSMKVYFSSGITEAMDRPQKTNWYGFLKELRQFAKRRLMAFDTRDIAKDNLDQRDFAFLSQNAIQQQNNANSEPVGESVMNESAMYGTKTMSFQKLMDTRLIIKHSQTLVDDTQPGARTRHISALFVENQDGERFKYPFIHLGGARAMQRHVANGGVPYDDVGKSIVSMSEQIAQLRSFNNYVVRNDLMNSDTNNIVERSSTALNTMREQVKKLAKQGYYESYIESFQLQETPEVPQDVAEDFTQKFTVRNFKEDIRAVFPVLYRLMQENDNTIDYDDIVEMTSEEDIRENSHEETYDPFSQFEDWAMSLGERSSIQDPDQRDDAVRELQELIGQNFPAGVDGTNAIESLGGIIDDPALHKQIQQGAKEDSGMDVRSVVKQWLEDNAPEVLDQLDFGDMQEQDYEDPMAYADASADADADYYGRQEGIEEVRQQKKFDTTMYVSNPAFDINAGDDDETEEEIEVGVRYEKTMVDPGLAPTWGDGGGDPGEGATYEAEIFQVVDLATGKEIDDPAVIEYIKDQLENSDLYSEDAHGAKKSDVPAALRKSKGDKDWKLSTQDLEKEKERNISSSEYLKKQNESVDTNELAEFISSFYDKDSGTFPKGPEGVATMVGKKFGEQAERAARRMVERMAPVQTTDNNPEIQELARIRELSGMQTEATHQFKKGDKVRIKNDKSGEVFTVYNLAGGGDSPDTVYLQQPEKSVATRAAVASGLELVPDGTPGGFKKGEQIKYKGKNVNDFGDVVTYRRPDMRNPDIHWIETKAGPFSVSTSELEKLDGKIVAMPEQVEADPVPELEDIKHLSGISQGIRSR